MPLFAPDWKRALFLKKITLHGFKSFADRTEFEFGPGITSIVGPNGCGKSNILDALRWVLGEQSAKQLRGHHMADVVFSGSRTRKSAPYAEVQIAFDNARRHLPLDQDEVQVSRLLYASGDSEYRLNGNTCRLKDIRDLLLDTGVGVDAYSVIEQGRVDAMLQANPIERREIFEEAAGISRYKARRAEAQRKLERAQQNLLRLNDVVDELEKRLRSVKVAAGKARNFQQYDARLRELRAAFSLAEYHELELQRAAQQQAAGGFAEALAGKRAALAQRDAEAAELAHAIQIQDERIRAGEQQLASLASELSALQERIAQGDRRLNDLSEMREQRLAQAAELQTRRATLDERVLAEEAGLAELAAGHAAVEANVDAQRAARAAAQERRDAARGSVEQLRSAAFEVARRSSLLSNDLSNAEHNGRRLAAQRQQLAARREELLSEQSAVTERRAAAQRTATGLEAALTEAGERLRSAEAEAAALRGDLEALRQQIAAAKENRGGAASRIALLEELERTLEGVDEGARAVLAWRDGGAGSDGAPAADAGVLGLVADLLRIDDPRMSALHSVLAEIEGQVVVRNAHDFLAELARRGAPPGAVRVIALDRVAPPVAAPPYTAAPGVLARAADWVRCPDELRPLAESLLGRVFVVDEFERALALAGAAPEGFTFVALDGRAVSGGRLCVGGASSRAGLIGRKAQVRQLRIERDEIEAQLDLAARNAANLEQARADGELRREAILSELARLQREQAENRSAVARCDDDARRNEREVGYVERELAAAERAAADLVAQAERLTGEQSQLVVEQAQQQARLEFAAAELAELDTAAAVESQALTDLLVELGRVSERRSAAEAALSGVRQQLAALQQQQSRTQQEAQRAAEQIESTRAEIAQTRARAAAAEDQRAIIEADLLEQRQTRQQLRQRIEDCGAAVKELHDDIEELDSALHECQATLRELAVRSESLVSRIRDELGLQLAELYSSYEHAEQDWDAIRGEIDELRGKIQRLGNVNLDAIAELEELAPRYDNLVAQRQDLLDSIQRLQALIDELDSESRMRFAATFATIREHFQELFRKLFGGGRADVILENPDAPLESGIEIVARPPGKEPQSISLLSGGEKTMTAVALLLAVFRSKPSPFTVLDEVDAALDEANVGRFNTVLREFLDQTQFVVITHHKRTMQSADVLYGITMEEPGVSKRVAVKFEDATLEPV